MKAKEYYTTLTNCQDEKEFPLKVKEILDGFVFEIETMIKARNAKSSEAVKSIINELDKKWISFVNLVEKNNTNTYDIQFTKEMFKEHCVKVIPELKKYIKTKEDKIPQIKQDFVPHKVKPFNEITKENITTEILCCIMALGQYSSKGIPIEFLTPLADRISFLRYWEKCGINYEEVELFEKDRKSFLKEKLIF